MFEIRISKTYYVTITYVIYLILTLVFITDYSKRLYIWIFYLVAQIIFIFPIQKLRESLIANSTVTKFFVLLLLHGILWTIGSIPSTLFSYSIEYARIYIPYVLCMWFTVTEFVVYDKVDTYIDVSYWCIAIYMIAVYIQNFNGFEVLRWVTKIFERYDRYRVTFGFASPDIAACLALCVIICSMLRYNRCKKRQQIIMIFINAIMAIMILSTGCRSQFIALLLIVGMKFYFALSHIEFKNLAQKIGIKTIKTAIIGAVVLGVVNEYFKTTSLEEALTNSNRMGLFEVNIPLLIRTGKLLTGLVYASAGRFGEGRIGEYNLYYVDNYYVYLLMSSGLLGLAMDILAIYVVIHAVNKIVRPRNRQVAEILITMIVINLVMGLFSCAVIYPNYVHCTIFWTIPLMYIVIYDKVEKVEKNERELYC